MTEIQGKSILVRVSARFELARVRVIRSRLYSESTRGPRANRVSTSEERKKGFQLLEFTRPPIIFTIQYNGVKTRQDINKQDFQNKLVQDFCSIRESSAV